MFISFYIRFITESNLLQLLHKLFIVFHFMSICVHDSFYVLSVFICYSMMKYLSNEGSQGHIFS